jgi:hypothetical protein
LRLAGGVALNLRDTEKALQDLVEAALLTERPLVAIAGQPATDGLGDAPSVVAGRKQKTAQQLHGCPTMIEAADPCRAPYRNRA